MPGTVIGVKMNQGYPGTFARNADCIIASRMVRNVAGDNGPNFGDPCVLIGSASAADNNTYQSVADFIAATRTAGTFTAALFAGIAVREVKTYQTYTVQPAGGMPAIGGYLPGTPCDVLERGSASVVCNAGTPVAGGAVYLRIAAGTVGVVGGFEYRADTDSGKCVLLTNALWTTGLMDANNVCEMTILSRNLP